MIVVHIDTMQCINAEFRSEAGQKFVENLCDNIDKRYGSLCIKQSEGCEFQVSVSDCLTDVKARATKWAVERQIEYCLAAWEG